MGDTTPSESLNSPAMTDTSATAMTVHSSNVASPGVPPTNGKVMNTLTPRSGPVIGSSSSSRSKPVSFAEPVSETVRFEASREPSSVAVARASRNITFSNDQGVTRCIETVDFALQAVFNAAETAKYKVVAYLVGRNEGVWYFYFDDIRGAQMVKQMLALDFSIGTCHYVHPQTAIQALKKADKSIAMSIYNGQLVISAEWTGDYSAANYHDMFTKCNELAKSYGPVRCFAALIKGDRQASFRVEMYKLSSVDDILKSTGTNRAHDLPPNIAVSVFFYHHDGPCNDPPSDSETMASLITGAHNLTLASERVPIPHAPSLSTPRGSISTHPGQPTMSESTITSPSPWTTPASMSSRTHAYAHVNPYIDAPTVFAGGAGVQDTTISRAFTQLHPQMSLLPTAPAQELQHVTTPTQSSRGPSAPGGRRARRGNGEPSHPGQTVDLAAIESGQDVRTTLMLRNLPNKLTGLDVMNMIFATSKGRVDFLYVRIDFSTGFNVGYGFVNFITPDAIADFLKASVGRPWAGYDNNKVLEVSYATIQGQDCLIQKFRNSSVLKECDAYTPKLFYSIYDNIPFGKLPGDTKPFPPPDNQQKFSRSLDNARTIGLFNRDAGTTRDERRTRSQYDRGTPRAMRDEAVAATRIGSGRAGRGRGGSSPGTALTRTALPTLTSGQVVTRLPDVAFNSQLMSGTIQNMHPMQSAAAGVAHPPGFGPMTQAPQSATGQHSNDLSHPLLDPGWHRLSAQSTVTAPGAGHKGPTLAAGQSSLNPMSASFQPQQDARRPRTTIWDTGVSGNTGRAAGNPQSHFKW